MASYDISLGGNDLTVTPYFLTLTGVDKLLHPGARNLLKGRGTIDGAAYGQGGVNPLMLKVQAEVYGTTPAVLATRLDALKELLYSSTLASLQLGIWPSRFWKVLLWGEQSSELVGDCGQALSLEFLAPDPNAYSATETEAETAIVGDGQSFVIAALSTADSTTFLTPEIEIQADAGATSIQVANLTLSQSLTWTGSISAGEYWKMDSDLGLVYTSADGVTWTTSANVSARQFPLLQPGVANTIQVTGVAAGLFTIRYRQRFRP